MEIHFCLTVHFFNRPVYPAVFMSVKKLLVSIKKKTIKAEWITSLFPNPFFPMLAYQRITVR